MSVCFQDRPLARRELKKSVAENARLRGRKLKKSVGENARSCGRKLKEKCGRQIEKNAAGKLRVEEGPACYDAAVGGAPP